jgi:hypothetical protein
MRRGAYRNNPYRAHGYVGNPGSSDRFGWLVDGLAGSLVVDWADVDGVNPEVGPTLSPGGTITPGQPTPWKRFDGEAVTLSTFADGAYYADSGALDPTAGHDIIAVDLVRRDTAVAGNKRLFGTLVATYGWALYYLDATDMAVFWCRSSAGDVSAQVALSKGDLVLLVGVMEASGNQTIYANSVQGTSLASPGGAVASGVGIGLAGAPSGILAGDSSSVRKMAWYGSGIGALVTSDWLDELKQSVLG